MLKDKMEATFRNAGLHPVWRQKLNGLDVYIADGFSLMPHLAWQKFGIEPDEFKRGMYVTMFFLGADDKIALGAPLFCDVSHNPELDATSRKQARINAAVKFAADALAKCRKKH